MKDKKTHPTKTKRKPFCPQQVLRWAMWHPGVLLLSTLAVRTMMGNKRELRRQAIAAHLHETDADILDGDIPLFL